MKKNLLIVYTIFYSMISVGQTVNIKVNNETDSNLLHVQVPLKGYTFSSEFNTQKFTIYGDKFNTLEFNNDTGGMYVFYVAGVRFSLLLFPGDDVQVETWIQEKDYRFEIKGTNSLGHMHWVDYNRPRYKKILLLYEKYKKYKTPEEILPVTINHVDSVVREIKVLHNENKISEQYFNLLAFYIKDEIGSFGFIDYLAKHWEGEWSRCEPLIQEYASYMNLLREVKLYNIRSDYLITFASKNYINKTQPQDYHSVLRIYGYLLNLNGKQKEFGIAHIIAFGASRGTDEFNWKEAYAYFQKEYPHSVCLPYLKGYLRSYLQTEKHKANINLIDTTQWYDTFDEFMKQNFKGQYVFIDLWATWCGPCRSEFQYAEDLHEVLDRQNVKMLYLSVDKDHFDKKWKKFIESSVLDGCHYRTGVGLYFDIQDRFYNGGSIKVPRYILVAPDGTVIDADMPRPSSREVLYNRIKELVKL